MVIELHRNPTGGFTVIAKSGRTVTEIAHTAFDFFQEARQFAASEAARRGCSLINNVSDDVPATHLSRNRKGI
jgi:hypothetical protein